MPGPVELRSFASNVCVLARQESQLKLLVQAAGAREAGGRPGLNVCLALDRSFSMQEDHKLERAREAAATFIDALDPADTFSLVEFGTDVRVAVEAQAGLDKERLKAEVYSIQPRGATNLHGAIHAAGAQVMHGFQPKRINRVVLLSDGIPTEGVTSDEEIQDVARRARDLGISITTLGLGYDYDEVLLSAVSEISRGNHYFIERAAEIAPILNRELQRMESVVARDVRLSVAPIEGARLTLSNTRYETRQTAEDRGTSVVLDDLERGGVQPVLFELELPPLDVGEATVAEVRLEFSLVEPGGALRPASLQNEMQVKATMEPAEVRNGIQREVLRQWEELDALQTVATVVEQGRQGARRLDEVVDVVRSKTRLLERAGSPRAGLLERVERTIVEQGAVTSEVAKRTIVERMRAQQGVEGE